MTDLKSTLKAFEGDLVAIRRDIHKHPETAYQEERTADIVARNLEAWGIEVHRGLGKTGVVGTVRGRHQGNRAIGLRADMDALHIEEKNTFVHKSVVPGKMHACGHDGHTAMLLGAARYLAANPDFAGTIHFIFQPAEEGEAGARAMIEDGLFERFPCDAVYGMHNMPGFAVGTFAIRPGPMLAASDTWTVTFKGTGGHGAMPEKGTDPTVPAGLFIAGLQTIIGRNVASADSAVLSIGHISAGAFASPSVIPSEVVIRGTARSFQPATRDLLERRLAEVAAAIATSQNCTALCVYQRRYPALINRPEQTALAIEAAAATVGRDRVEGNTPPISGAEDFAFMLEAKPGAYIMIGNGGDRVGGICHDVHTPLYDFNDEILTLGTQYWINLAARELAPAEG